MWRSKKFIIITLTVAAVLGASIAGVAVAQTENEDACQPKDRQGAMLNRVCEIYEENTGDAVDPQGLRDAFAQARSEMREEALQNRLQHMVENGRITQDEADQYKEWMQSMPDVPVKFGFKGGGGFHGGGRMFAP